MNHALLIIMSLLSSSCQAFVVHGNRWGPPQPRRMKADALGTAADQEILNNKNAVEEVAPNNNNNEVKTCDILSLGSIRSTLIRQEETIIFALIERSQFRQNAIVYQRGGFGNLGIPLGSTAPSPIVNDGADTELLSFLEYMLVGTETLHCGVRRYTSPEEHPFFPERLPEGPMGALPLLDYPQDLLSTVGNANDVNFNPVLLDKYIHVIVPAIATRGDDEQHGSTVLCDIAALQALSRRVHYGKFVAESKYRADPAEYERLVEANDDAGVMRLLTNEAVEEQVLRRAKLKAATYGREPALVTTTAPEGNEQHDGVSVLAAASTASADDLLTHHQESKQQQGKVDPAVIESVYRDIVIPLTKDVEVAYLFRRCGKEPPPQYAPDRMSVDVTSLKVK